MNVDELNDKSKQMSIALMIRKNALFSSGFMAAR